MSETESGGELMPEQQSGARNDDPALHAVLKATFESWDMILAGERSAIEFTVERCLFRNFREGRKVRFQALIDGKLLEEREFDLGSLLLIILETNLENGVDPAIAYRLGRERAFKLGFTLEPPREKLRLVAGGAA